ncbi:caspase domain-containing protein [Streptomyces sp. NPDC048507]|uniref:caspase family protein n=1 Tax=Streptomyces sp. NPDC048507 TaxID=3365560 RepID=UPI003719F0E1
MGKVYALLVGINEYRGLVLADLRGCLNDVAEARAALEAAAPGRVDALTLTDGEATAGAVEAGIRGHLAQAGPEDTALLWFSGHGTQYAARTELDRLTEPTGRCQALVCADGPLPDKRLGALLDGAATGGGAVVAVLDCCFSGGASRDGLVPRGAPPLTGPPPVAVTRDAVGPDTRPRHLLLAASRLDQAAFERPVEGPGGSRTYGVFSYALTRALRRAGPAATARELLAEADAGVRRLAPHQQPVLFPAGPGDLADRPPLGGAARAPSAYLLRQGQDGWEVDCGRVHGLTGEAGTEFTAAGGPVRVTAVRADRSLAEPVGWSPEPGSVHAVALSALALAPAAVVLDGAPVALPASPLLREVEAGSAQEAGAELLFRVVVRGGRARVLRRDGSPYVDPLPLAGRADAQRLGDCLTRLTHWHRIRGLSAGLSPLSGRVRIEVLPGDGRDGEPLRPDAQGEIVLAYDGPRAPWITVRLRNTGPRPLWCVLLNLDDRFGAGSALFPGEFIGPGMTGHALDGEPLRMELPAVRPVRPGASVRDWLTLVVAEGELNTVPFHLSAWDPWQGRPGTVRRPPGDGLLRLTGPPGASGDRDLVRALPAGPGRWTASTVALRTVVPGPGAPAHLTAPGA